MIVKVKLGRKVPNIARITDKDVQRADIYERNQEAKKYHVTVRRLEILEQEYNGPAGRKGWHKMTFINRDALLSAALVARDLPKNVISYITATGTGKYAFGKEKYTKSLSESQRSNHYTQEDINALQDKVDEYFEEVDEVAILWRVEKRK